MRRVIPNIVPCTFFLSQYEELNSMGMLLTDTQRKWVTFLKEAARKKPPTRQIRPKVSIVSPLNIALFLPFENHDSVKLRRFWTHSTGESIRCLI